MSRALIYGGSGQLGRTVVTAFKKGGWNVTSVDFVESKDADTSIILKGDAKSDTASVCSKLTSMGNKLDVVCSVAGGFDMGAIDDINVFDSLDKMWRFNVQSTVAAGHVSSKFLKDDGLLVLTGAAAGCGPTGAFIGYGASKAAVHQIVASLSSADGKLPKGSTVTAILPVMLDTPSNRSAMPDADYSTWTPLSALAEQIVSWSTGERPGTGDLMKVTTTGGKTSWTKEQ